jgi:hypothetical protein
MYCKNCNNQINEQSKFCGKCGNRLEQLLIETHDSNTKESQEELVRDIKSIGKLFEIIGYLGLTLDFLVIFLFLTTPEALEFSSVGYFEIIFILVISIIFIILGRKVRRRITKNTKTFLMIFFWLYILNIIFSFIPPISPIGIGISLILALQANKGIRKLKFISLER